MPILMRRISQHAQSRSRLLPGGFAVPTLMALGLSFASSPAQAAPSVTAAAAQAQHPVAPGAPAASSPGTNIANAGVLTSAAVGKGTIVAGSDDWWVVYPATPGGVVNVKVTNKLSGAGCFITAILDGTNGRDQQIQNIAVNSGTSGNLTGTASGSDRYFVEVTPDGCGSTVPYTVTLVSGGGGTPPNPAAGSIPAGTSIANAWPPLGGHKSYPGVLASLQNADWFVLYKKPDTTLATIRAENTGNGCFLNFVLFGSTGSGKAGAQLQSTLVGGDSAASFTIPGKESTDPQGRYFMTVSSDGCSAAGEPYSIEPEPAAEWGTPALKVTTITLKKGTVSQAYSATIGVSEGKAPYSFTAETAMPPGLSLGTSTGVISGIPTKAGKYAVTIKITDSTAPTAKSVTDTFSITIAS